MLPKDFNVPAVLDTGEKWWVECYSCGALYPERKGECWKCGRTP